MGLSRTRARVLPGVLTALALTVVPCAFVVSACSKTAGAEEKKSYTSKGTVKSIAEGKQSANIAHEDIPGYMSAMTMSFQAGSPGQLDSLAAGDKVVFTFTDEANKRVLVTIAKAP